MRPKRGTVVRYNLTDGTTLGGTLEFSWPWSRYYRITDALFYDPRTTEPIPASGTILISKRAVLFIQFGDE